ncbi:MAG: hypothetical protein JSV25_04795 [Spirochaetota bacterium]|nr:MAG: hypothetical protein JSV25_04795 [Spirochaetota bacterium]
MNRDIDQTRNKLGVDALDTQQRKKLFQDFVDHGGQVVEKKKPAGAIKQPGPETRVKPKEREVKVEPKKKPPAQIEKTVKTPVKVKKGKALDIIRINIKGQMLKVWSIGGKKFKDKFVSNVGKEIKDSLININLITGSMLRGDSSVKREILRSSTGEDSFFYECIVRLNSIYDEDAFSEFQKAISNKKIPESSYLELVKNLFKQLYILGQHTGICRLHALQAIEIQKKYKKIKPEIVSRVQRGLRREVDLILGDFYYKLHIILCKMERKFFTLYSQKLDDFLEITEKDRMGYITRLEKRRRIEELKKGKEALQKEHKEKETAKVEKEEVKVPKHIERGMPIIKQALQQYEMEHSGGENPLSIIEYPDKMYDTLVLLDTFDSQYSFILTTGKITFNIEYIERKKVDIKEDLNHAYYLFNESREEAKSYMDTIKEIRNLENDTRLTQYQRSVQLEKLEKKRQILSRKSRNEIIQVMKRIEEILSVVIDDYKGDKTLLQNPDEYLSFDVNIDGDKKLDGRKVMEAIVVTFLFSATFAYMLNYGELSGPGITKDLKVFSNSGVLKTKDL